MADRFIEFTNSAGETLRAERHERFVRVSEIEYSPRFQEYCRNCPSYGKNLACPPSAPDFPSYAGDAGAARIICIRVPIHSHIGASTEARHSDARQAGKLLTDELVTYQKQGQRVAGAGACHACRTCAAEKGKSVCAKPGERIFSLEAMGVNVSSLLQKNFHFSLEWNRDGEHATFICAVGAVLHEEFQNN